MKVDMTGFVDGLKVGVRKRRVQDDFKILA